MQRSPCFQRPAWHSNGRPVAIQFEAMEKFPETFLVVGDVHGHLQLALTIAARLQRERVAAGDSRFSAVFLCGDVGTFTEAAQLDSATRNFSKTNQCELEFLYQWSRPQPPAWLEWIFRPDGLDLTCPVVMVYGNHEGFEHLERLVPSPRPVEAVTVADLPPVDAGLGRILLLPSGWRIHSDSGWIIGGVGGIEAGQRHAKYHPMAYIEGNAVDALLAGSAMDILLTHQGPAYIQDQIGSSTLDILLHGRRARSWFHGHGFRDDGIKTVDGCQVVPLADVAFVGRGAKFGEPGVEGYAIVTVSEKSVEVVREPPSFWRDYRQKNWTRVSEGWVSPDLTAWIP